MFLLAFIFVFISLYITLNHLYITLKHQELELSSLSSK
jgi:hypothetical protein